MHYINVSGMVRGQTIYQLLISGLFNRYVRGRYWDELISRTSALLELIGIRENSFNLSGWDIQEINSSLSAICRD